MRRWFASMPLVSCPCWHQNMHPWPEHWRPDGVARCRWISANAWSSSLATPSPAARSLTVEPGPAPIQVCLYRSRHRSRMSGTGRGYSSKPLLPCCSCPRRAGHTPGERSGGQSFLRGSSIVRFGKTTSCARWLLTKLNRGASLSAADAGKAVPDRRIMIGGQP